MPGSWRKPAPTPPLAPPGTVGAKTSVALVPTGVDGKAPIPVPTTYVLEKPVGGRTHAWRRHTWEGIVAAKRIESAAKGLRVAIFADEKELDDAIARMPSTRTHWEQDPKDKDRYDAEIQGVHYQATLVGEILSLRTCFPTSGPRQFQRKVVLDYLKEQLGAVADPRRAEGVWRRDPEPEIDAKAEAPALGPKVQLPPTGAAAAAAVVQPPPTATPKLAGGRMSVAARKKLKKLNATASAAAAAADD